MTYNVVLYEQAQEDLAKLALSEPKAFAKAQRFIEELKEHPKTGTGKPEALKGNRNGQWSREITKKHRLIYEIHDSEVLVLVLTAYGHYNDK
jgi:toxin YoeB